VFLARLRDIRGLAYFSDRDLPPAVVSRHGFVAVYGDVDDHRVIDLFCRKQGVAKLFDVARAKDMRAEPFGVLRQVDRQPLAVAVRRVVAE